MKLILSILHSRQVKLRLTVCLGERKCRGMERKGMVDSLEDLKIRGRFVPFHSHLCVFGWNASFASLRVSYMMQEQLIKKKKGAVGYCSQYCI